MICSYKRLPPGRIADAAQANLEISYSRLRYVLVDLRRIPFRGRFPILHHQYRANYGAGAFRAHSGSGVGISK